LYANDGKRFFPKSSMRSLMSTVYGSKFPEKGLEKLMLEQFGNHYLSDAFTDLTVATYDIEFRRGFFFKIAKAKRPELADEYDFLMRDVARATSAAPTYFSPASVQAKGFQTQWHLVDGGVCANNPAMIGYREAMRIHGHDDICLVSIGTG
jgi:patatin-like phospholipase/acyl hydrolase